MPRVAILGRLALITGLLVLALLVAAQLVLPEIASQRLRDRLEPDGQVMQASVSAFPAFELLWDHASSVTVRMTSYRDPVHGGTSSAHASRPAISPPRRLADLLASMARTDTLNAQVGVVQSGRLVLDDVALTKNGDQLEASATITSSDLRVALPSPFTLRSISSESAELQLHGAVHVLSSDLNVTAVVRTRNGALVVLPDLAGLVPSFLSLTVFSDPRIRVDLVTADQEGNGWRLTARAHLTG